MANKPELPTRLVLVEWIDALTGDAGWKSLKKLRKQAPCIVRSVGYLVTDHADYVTIAASVVEVDGTLDGDVTVPRGMVKSVTDLVQKPKE